jgi:general secretion pathway protein K
VSVLWTIALLSALAMAAGVTFRGFAGVLSVEHARLQVAALQTAGLEIAVGLVESLNDRPVSEVSTDIKLSTGSVRLLISDDGGLIDVGRAPEEVLAGLFQVIGAPQDHAIDVARAIVAWRNRDTGLGGPQALSSDAAKRKSAGDRPFTDVRQLALVPVDRAVDDCGWQRHREPADRASRRYRRPSGNGIRAACSLSRRAARIPNR